MAGVGVSRVEVWLAVPVGDQRRHARELLRRAAAAALGVGVGELVMAREPGGRPYVALRAAGAGARPVPAVGVSVSHTRGLTAVAVGTGGGDGGMAVGVDVEPVRDLPALALARRWFRDEEVRWIEGHAPDLRVRALLWVWTHKEALGKACGTGLARGGRLRPVPLPGGGVPRPRAGQPARLRELSPGADLTSAVHDVGPGRGAPEGYVLCVAGGPGTGGVPVAVRRADG